MPTIVHQYTASFPANTPIASPVTVPIGAPGEVVVFIDVEVPPGPAGLMGFYIAYNGARVVPRENAEYIIWDDQSDTWYLDDYPTTGAWSVVGYNLSIAYAHAVTIRFHDDPLPTPTAPSGVSVNIITTPTDQAEVIL